MLLLLSTITSVLGDILVVKPSFMFSSLINNTNNTSVIDDIDITVQSVEQLKESDNYFLGVGLCLYVAAACAFSNVINVSVMKSNERITTSHLMLTSGVFCVLLSVASTFLLPNRLITAPLSLPTTSAVILLVSALMTFLAFWFITLAVTITKSPTLISMLRSTEIILSLVTESVWWGEPPHYLSVLGSLLVTFVLRSCQLSDSD